MIYLLVANLMSFVKLSKHCW